MSRASSSSCTGRCTCCNSKAKCQKYTGIGVALFGLATLLFGIFFSHYILQEFQHQLHHSLRLQTPEEDQTLFNHWQNDNYPGATPEHWKYYMWNVTNCGDVASTGAIPVVKEIGPYVYREFKTRFNVTFSDGNNLVTYNEMSLYEYEESMSCESCHETNIIVGLWPTYITLVKEAGSAQNAAAVLMSPLMNITFTALAHVAKFRNLCATDKECNMLALSHWRYGSGLGNVISAGTSMKDSPDFISALTDVNMEIFGELLSSMPFSTEYAFALEGALNSSSFSLSEAYGFVFNHTFACALGSEQSPDPSMGCATFYLDCVNKGRLPRCFPGLDADSANFMTAYLASFVLATKPTKPSQLQPQPLSALCSLGNSLDVGDGLCAYRAGPVKEWLFQLDDPFLRLQLAGTVGVDPGRGSMSANSAYFANLNASTTEQSWEEDKFFTTTQTGKKDINQIDSEIGFESNMNKLPKYNELTSTGYFCAGSSTIYGKADHQPFAPGTAGWFKWKESFTKDDTTQVWVDEMLRAVTLKYREEYNYRGIKVYRYEIADSEFVPKPQYDISLPGVLNMTCPNHGTPIQLTQPHYAKAVFPNSMRVEGVSPPIPDEHYAFLDVSPLTGETLIGHERIQINLYVKPAWIVKKNTSGEFNTPKLHPAMWVEDSAHMSDQDEHEFKSGVIGTLYFHRVFLITTLVVGSVTLVAGCIIWYVGFRIKAPSNQQLGHQRGEYETLGTITIKVL
mmetsp:Transcript_25909/g.36106  ORF Transcript_25909/g.36106 Transcript_25909/m.36106 type:complete len:736 (+) Transcript_25909:70-2277(+)